MHQQRHSLKPSLQHPDLSAIRVYSSACWFHKLFCVFTCFHMFPASPQAWINDMLWIPKTSRQNFFPSRLSQFMPKWSAALLKAAVLLPVSVHFSTWNHINRISSPSRHTLAAWWSPWTPTGPCLSSRQTKWRSIATGTSTSSVHTCESTSCVLSNHPPNLL